MQFASKFQELYDFFKTKMIRRTTCSKRIFDKNLNPGLKLSIENNSESASDTESSSTIERRAIRDDQRIAFRLREASRILSLRSSKSEGRKILEHLQSAKRIIYNIIKITPMK